MELSIIYFILISFNLTAAPKELSVGINWMAFMGEQDISSEIVGLRKQSK